ncbi:MAG: response regulator transcription factor [Devosia sp.]
MIRIVVVDDHPMFRTGLIQAVTVDGDIAAVGEGGSAAEAVELVAALRPDVLLLDAQMADDGLGRIPDIVHAYPETRIVVVTASNDENDIARAVEAGVYGYVLKGTTGSDMRSIVRQVNKGENVIPKDMFSRLMGMLRVKSAALAQGGAAKLSKQETQVLQHLARGLSNREIGLQLDITERTVKFHLSNTFSKLHVRNRVEASITARRMWPGLEH